MLGARRLHPHLDAAGAPVKDAHYLPSLAMYMEVEVKLQQVCKYVVADMSKGGLHVHVAALHKLGLLLHCFDSSHAPISTVASGSSYAR